MLSEDISNHLDFFLVALGPGMQIDSFKMSPSFVGYRMSLDVYSLQWHPYTGTVLKISPLYRRCSFFQRGHRSQVKGSCAQFEAFVHNFERFAGGTRSISIRAATDGLLFAQVLLFNPEHF